MRLSAVALAGLLTLPLAVPVDAQTATPASPQPAKKDKKQDKQDKADKADKKVYTNEDLEEAGKDAKEGKGGAVTFLPGPEPGHDSGQGSTSASSESGRSSGSEEGRPASDESGAPGERGWRERAKEHRASLQNALAEVQKLQEKLDALRAPQQQPQPIEALQPDPQRRLTKDEERKQLEKDLEAAQAALADAQKALEDFLEEARRNNVPPGWVEDR